MSYIHHNRVDLRTRAGASAGTAAALRDREKRGHYERIGSDEYKFVPFSVETHGRVGKPAMTLLHILAHAAERHSNGFVSAESFTSCVLHQLACANVDWNARIETAVAGMFALVAGQAFMPEDPRPQCGRVTKRARVWLLGCLCLGLLSTYRTVDYRTVLASMDLRYNAALTHTHTHAQSPSHTGGRGSLGINACPATSENIPATAVSICAFVRVCVWVLGCLGLGLLLTSGLADCAGSH